MSRGEYFSYIFHIFHESPWTITSRSRTLENIRIHRKTCKIRKKYSRFLFVQYSRKNPRFSGKNFAPSIVAEQAPLHQTGRERLHLATSHRYYTRRGELDVAGFPSNQDFRIFVSFQLGHQTGSNSFPDELFHFRMSLEIVRSGGITITRQFARVKVVRKVSIVPC